MNRRLYIALLAVALFSPFLLLVTSVAAQTSPSGSGSDGSTPSTNSTNAGSQVKPAPTGPANNITGKNVADELNQDCKAGAGKDYDTTKQVKPGQQFAKNGKAVTNLQGVKCIFTQNGKKITGTCNNKNGGDCKADSSGKPNPSSTGSATSSGATPLGGGSSAGPAGGSGIPASTGESSQQYNPFGSNPLPWQNLDLPAEDNSAFRDLPSTSPDSNSNTSTGGNPSVEPSSVSAGAGPSSRENGFDPGGLSGGSTDLRVPSYGMGDMFPNESGQSGAQFASQASFKENTPWGGGSPSDMSSGNESGSASAGGQSPSWWQGAKDAAANISNSIQGAMGDVSAHVFGSASGDPLSTFTNPSSVFHDLDPQSQPAPRGGSPNQAFGEELSYFGRSTAPAFGDIVADTHNPSRTSNGTFINPTHADNNASNGAVPSPAISISGGIDWNAIQF